MRAKRHKVGSMGRALSWIALVLLMIFFTTFTHAQDQAYIESKLTDFIRKTYGADEELQIRFSSIPSVLRGTPKIKNVTFAKVPDGKGEGVCLVDIVEGRTNRDRSLYVPFRVITAAKVYVLTQSGKKGDLVKAESVAVREARFTEKKAGYPGKLDEIVGKALKRDVAAGTILAYSMLEAPLVIQKGEIVNIIAENQRLVVRTRGKAMETGRVGDSIRVKNTLSEKEIFGKVVDDNTVSVKF